MRRHHHGAEGTGGPLGRHAPPGVAVAPNDDVTRVPDAVALLDVPDAIASEDEPVLAAEDIGTPQERQQAGHLVRPVIDGAGRAYEPAQFGAIVEQQSEPTADTHGGRLVI